MRGGETMSKTIAESEKKEIKRRFLIAFSRTGVWSHSCERAGVSAAVIRSWLKKDKKFQKKFDQMQEKFVDTLEMVAVQRAVEKSDTLLLALLKANRPAKYRENVKLDADVKEDKTVKIVFSADEVADMMPNYATGVGVDPGRGEEGETDEE